MSAMADLDLMLTEYEGARANVAGCRAGSGNWFLAVEIFLRVADELVSALRSPAMESMESPKPPPDTIKEEGKKR